MEIAEDVGKYVGAFAFLGVMLLLPLCVSQARDLQRLRAWQLRAPNRQTAEFQAVEATGEFTAVVIDTGEIEVTARITQEHDVAAAFDQTSEEHEVAPQGTLVMPPLPDLHPPAPAHGQTPIPPARRLALDRPATARITMDHRALDPSPGRFGRLSWRALVAIVGGILAAGVGITMLALEISENDPAPSPTSALPGLDPSEIEVAVLNGTAIPDLAELKGDDLAAQGFVKGFIGNSQNPYDRSVVMYASGKDEEAQLVADALGIERIRPIDVDASRDSEGAEVVVIVGEDRGR